MVTQGGTEGTDRFRRRQPKLSRARLSNVPEKLFLPLAAVQPEHVNCSAVVPRSSSKPKFRSFRERTSSRFSAVPRHCFFKRSSLQVFFFHPQGVRWLHPARPGIGTTLACLFKWENLSDHSVCFSIPLKAHGVKTRLCVNGP